jgi:hypothetical protein
MLPSALSMLTTFTAAKDRRTALGVWGAVAPDADADRPQLTPAVSR